jgi:hypothetical protein
MDGNLYHRQIFRKKYYLQVRDITRSTFNLSIYRKKSWCDFVKAIAILGIISGILLLVAVIVIPIVVVRLTATRTYSSFFIVFEMRI